MLSILSYDQAIMLRGIYTNDVCPHTSLHVCVYAASLIIAPNWKQPRFSSVKEWIHRLVRPSLEYCMSYQAVKDMMPGLVLDTFNFSKAYFEQSSGAVEAPFQKVNLKAEHRMSLIWSVGRMEMVFSKMHQKNSHRGLHWSDAMGRIIKTLQK